MREEARVLEHVADAAAPGRDVDPGGRVGQDGAVQGDMALVRAQEAGGGLGDGGLARAGAAEEDRDPGGRLERGVEREAGIGVAQPDPKRHAPAARRAARAASASEATSARRATTTESATRRRAAPSPPGTWRKA